ncbi:hypothetical protein V7419_14995 [Bacillus sp. JJ689]|uniref:hypothetical protein n=1 Tax=Bacillus sp. JJ689 TaxID=3122949 RepID=UPI002FFFABBF
MIETPPLILIQNEGGFFISISYFTEKPTVKKRQPHKRKTSKISKENSVERVFNGLKDVDMDLLQEQVLDYVVIVKFTEYLSVEAIYELDWNALVSLKKWNGGKRTWYLNITEELKRKAKILYNTDSDIAM